MKSLSDKTAIVVGASRGLGHGIATALAAAGAPVVAVSRTAVAHAGQDNIEPVLADAADPAVATELLGRYQPRTVVLVAGAVPHISPLPEQTWESFSVNWEADVRIAFNWLREALLRPLEPGSHVVVFSSGAALNGSALSGGYAGAKAAQRFMTAYAQEEANRARLRLTFTALLPRITSETELGRPAVEAYANRAGQSVERYLEQMGPLLTPEGAGAAVVELVGRNAAEIAPAYLLTGAGLQELP